MKNLNLFSIFIMLLLAACSHNKQSANDLVTVDVTKTPTSQKELILQDFMDVEYIPLETNDEFITKGKVMDIGKDIIVVGNAREGDILLFDSKTGKSIKKINHRGQSGEEYLMLINILLDEPTGELFVNDGPSSKIQIYDLDGNYKRSIPYKKGAFVSNIFNYDKNYLLCQDTYAPANESSVNTFFLLSKQDGSMKDIEIPFEKKISTVIVKQVGDQVFGDGPRNRSEDRRVGKEC